MTPDVKSSNSREQARTRFARAAVVDAARTLFMQDGYAATTVEAISSRAGVPPATLYRLFSSKLGVLHALLDVAAGGDDEPIAFGDRADVKARLELADPVATLAAFAELATQVMARLAPIHRVLVGAAATDPQATELLADHTRQRQRGQARIAAALAGQHALRDGLSERAAGDIIYALLSPEVYQLLTVDRGWSSARYQAWLTRLLRHELLADE